MSASLAERVAALRDQVMETAARGDDRPPGSAVFDAVVRRVGGLASDADEIRALREALARRLAYGDPPGAVLDDVDSVCKRLLEASARAFGDPSEQMRVAAAVSDVGAESARSVARAVMGRASRERAALLREQELFRRLGDILARQQNELGRLED